MEQKDPHEPQRKGFFATRFIQFLGGRNLLYGLLIVLMSGIIIAVYDQIHFIFKPLTILFQTVVVPIVLSGILFYLLRPILRLMIKWGTPKVVGIIIIY